MARRRNKLDYFAFFPKDCEADEAIRMMDDAQFGFWMRCLCLQWPNGSIPADPAALALVLGGRAPGQSARTPEYVAEMLAGPVGLRMRQVPPNGVGVCPTVCPRLADPRLLEERSIAEAESQRNKRNVENKEGQNGVFVERKTDDPLNDSLFCSVLSKEQEIGHWFDAEFWPAYPRKTHKPAALAAAKKHGKTEAERTRIMETLRRALPELQRGVKPDGDFRPYPASWLNSEPWLDEPSAPTPASAPATVVSTMDPETRRRLDERRRG